MRILHTLTTNARVGSREDGHRTWNRQLLPVLRDGDGIALTLDAIHARLDEDAITLRLVGTRVGSTDSSHKVAVVRHDEVILVTDTSK